MNDQILSDAQAAAEAIDLAYNEADFPTKMQMKASRDAAFEAVASARTALVGSQVTVTAALVTEMAGIRSEIEKAADTQTLIAGSAKLVALLAKLAPVA